MKVYCKDCKWFSFTKTGRIYTKVVYFCEYPENKKVKKEKDWYGFKTRVICSKKPKEINANNDCSWFKEKNKI